MVLFFTHILFVVNHTINATPPQRLQQHPFLFTMNRTDPTFFVWRLNFARPSHPGHSTILLRSEIPSSVCAKLRTVAASINIVHMPWSLYYCLFVPHICMVLFFKHILFVVNHTINATPPERLQHFLHRMSIWDVYFKVCKVLTCQYRWVGYIFTLMSTPVTRKKHPTEQNISLVREEDIKMLALQSKI